MKASFHALLAALLPLCLVGQPGTLDPTFGTGGVATFTTAYDAVNPIRLHALPNGRFLGTGVIGDASPNSDKVLLFRAMSNGALDGSFGQQGLVDHAPTGFDAQCISTSLRPDGSVIAVGFNEDTDRDMAIWKFTPNGSLDQGFGVNGQLTWTNPASTDVLLDLVEITPGTFIACGMWTDMQEAQVCLVKFDEAGVLDASFGTNGKVTHDLFPGEWEMINGIRMDANGDLLAQVSKQGNIPLMARFNSNGTLDAGYGSNGLVQLPGNCAETYPIMDVLPNGNVLLASANVQNRAQFIQVDDNGALAAGFGTNGVVVAEPSSDPTLISSLMALPDGSWLAAGSIDTPIPMRESMVCHYLPDGSLDPNFGSNGCFRQTFFYIPRSWDMVLDPSGRLIVMVSKFNSTVPAGTHLIALGGPLTGLPEGPGKGTGFQCGSANSTAFVELPADGTTIAGATFHDVTGKLVAQVQGIQAVQGMGRTLPITYPAALEPGCYVLRLIDRQGRPIGSCAVVKGQE